MAQIHKYGVDFAYGISEDNPKATVTVGNIKIYPTSVSVSKEGEVKQYRGAAGTVIGLVIPDQFDQLTVEGFLPAEYRTAAADIKKGEVCDIQGLNVDYDTTGSLRLESWSVSWSNEDVARVSCTIKQYPDIDAN